MNKKEFEEKFYDFTDSGEPLSVTKTFEPLWQWIEEYGKQQRTEERKEIIEKINLRLDKYVYRD